MNWKKDSIAKISLLGLVVIAAILPFLGTQEDFESEGHADFSSLILSTPGDSVGSLELNSIAMSTQAGSCEYCAEYTRITSQRDLEQSIRDLTLTCQDRNSKHVIQGINSRGSLGLVQKILEIPMNVEAIDSNCIDTAMARYKAGVGICTAGKLEYSTAAGCVDHLHTSLAHRSLEIVNECVFKNSELFPRLAQNSETQKASLKSFLEFTAHEGGFHLNALSPRMTDIGPVQMTQIAIKDVNQRLYEKMKANFANSTNPLCRLAAESLSKKMDDQRATATCESLAPGAGHPLKNLIYGAAYMEMRQGYMESMIYGSGANQARAALRAKLSGLSDSDRAELSSILNIWTHNTGVGFLAVPMQMALQLYYPGNAKVTNLSQFIKQLKDAVGSYTQRLGMDSTTANVKVNFVDRVKKDAKNRMGFSQGVHQCLK